MEEPIWRKHLPAILILGSPIVASGMLLSAALINIFLLPDVDLITVGVAIMLRLNALLGPIGAAVGALRIHGTGSTRIAVLLASVVFATAVYAMTILLSNELIPGFSAGFEEYGP